MNLNWKIVPGCDVLEAKPSTIKSYYRIFADGENGKLYRFKGDELTYIMTGNIHSCMEEASQDLENMERTIQ